MAPIPIGPPTVLNTKDEARMVRDLYASIGLQMKGKRISRRRNQTHIEEQRIDGLGFVNSPANHRIIILARERVKRHRTCT